MSLGVRFDIPKSEDLYRDIREVRRFLGNMTGVNEIMSAAVVHGSEYEGKKLVGVREHIREAARTRHKSAMALGARPTGYLEIAADSVMEDFDNRKAGFVIAENAAIFRRAFGAVRVRIQDNKWLCIPADKRTYGKSPLNFDIDKDFTFVVFRKNELAAFLWKASSFRRVRNGASAASGYDAGRNTHVDLSEKPKRAARAKTAAKAKAAGDAEHKLDVAFWCKKEVLLPEDRELLPSNERILDLMEAGFRVELERRLAQLA